MGLQRVRHDWATFTFTSLFTVCVYGVSLVAQLVNDLPAKQEALVWFLGWEVPLKKEYSSILGLSWWLRWQRICLQCGRPGFGSWIGKIPWRRAWQPTPVFLPGVSPWTEEPGGLQSMESHRVGHYWETNTFTNTCVSVVKNPLANQCRRFRFDHWIGKISRRRKWQPTPVFLPEKSHGQRRLWVCAQSLQLYLTLCDPVDLSPPGLVEI